MSEPFGRLPHYLQQRVLAGVLYHDHKATAAACKAFRAIIRGPGFLTRTVNGTGHTGTGHFSHSANGTVAGGRTEQGMFSARPLLTLQIYDIATRTWRQGPPLPGPGIGATIGCVGAFGQVIDGKLVLVKHGVLLTYDPQSETWTESASYPSEGRYPPRMHHACVHNGRIIVFMENGSAFARAADGSWATYEGAAAVGPPVFGLLAPQHYVSASVLLG